MCGGVGSRFWPHSREEKPKQFLDFFGAGRSLLQLTVDRVRNIVPPQNILLVTNQRYAKLIHEQLPDIPTENILPEPARRNTSPCICRAAHHIYALDCNASIVTLPSDHLVLREIAFADALKRGFEFVENGNRLLTLGIKPTSPNTGYGYIQQGTPVPGLDNFFKVKSFTEKPNREMAELFISTGEFYWNAGMFLWSARAILDAFDKYAPETAAVFNQGNDVWGSPDEAQFIERHYPSAPAISIDYDIMEKADNVYVETVDLGWSDVGSWKALYDASPKDSNGNVSQNSRTITKDCHNSIFAVNGDKIIAAAGLNDYIVADSGNALLICPKDMEQRIRNLVNEVKELFGSDYI